MDVQPGFVMCKGEVGVLQFRLSMQSPDQFPVVVLLVHSGRGSLGQISVHVQFTTIQICHLFLFVHIEVSLEQREREREREIDR